MTELYLIRHVQAEGNLYRMMQGHWDGDVTEPGRKQRDALAERFAGMKIDAVYSSDLYRAAFTATAITLNRPEMKIRLRRALRELDIGPLEKAFFGDYMHRERESMTLFMYDSEKWSYEGAETFMEAGGRALEEIEKISRRHDGQSVAVVSHGITIRSFLSIITGIPLNDTARLPICGNTAVTKLIYSDGEFKVEYFNDTSHLGDVPRWGAVPSLRAERLDPVRDSVFYCGCYADAWKGAHGNLKGYQPEVYLKSATDHCRSDRDAVLKLFDGDTPAGIIEMDINRGAEKGTGWVAFLYLAEEYRKRGIGIQALGRAIMHYSDLGRENIGLSVAEDNTAALAFYRKWGFAEKSSFRNGQGRIITMERRIDCRDREGLMKMCIREEEENE